MRLQRGEFDGAQLPTIGVDFFERRVAVPSSSSSEEAEATAATTTTTTEAMVTLNVWDTAGQGALPSFLSHTLQPIGSPRRNDDRTTTTTRTTNTERFRSVSTSYLQGAAAAVVVFDLTQPQSLGAAEAWLDELLGTQRGIASACVVLAGNKDDLQLARRVAESDGLRTAQRHGVAYLETSALTAHNVAEAFDFLARRLCCLSLSLCFAHLHSSLFVPSRRRRVNKELHRRSRSGRAQQRPGLVRGITLVQPPAETVQQRQASSADSAGGGGSCAASC